jgi:hypothetical protein
MFVFSFGYKWDMVELVMGGTVQSGITINELRGCRYAMIHSWKRHADIPST